MPSPLNADSFRSIRTWAGSKDRAFEELCYQLLREDDDLPPGKPIPVRTGNPDGGVEWNALTRENAQWGWQAKYIFDIGSLLSAMTVTVRRVVKERPELVRLTFCIPWNLPAGTSGRQRVSARQKYENKVTAWKRDIKGCENIEFLLVQESDLLARLALPKHAGRRWFWWNEPYFGSDWLQRHLQKQADIAGERYRPELQVDLPIQDDLAGLGFSATYFDAFDRHKASVLRALAELREPHAELENELAKSFDVAMRQARVLQSTLKNARPLAIENDPLSDLAQAVSDCQKTLQTTRDQLIDYEQKLEGLPKNGVGRKHLEPCDLESIAYGVH
jgi:hypothetical protein